MFHPQLPLRMPCYDFTLVTEFALESRERDAWGTPGFLGMTGGEYKTRERIHRGMLIRDY